MPLKADNRGGSVQLGETPRFVHKEDQRLTLCTS